MTKLKFLFLACVALIFLQGAALRAAVVQLDGSGRATAILGLTIGSNTYNVDFVVGSYNSVFPGGELFPDAAGIVAGSVSALNGASVPVPLLDVLPFDRFLVPSASSGGTFTAPFGFCTGPPLPCGFPPSTNPDIWQSGGPTDFSKSQSGLVLAVPTAVPLPGAFWLFGSGLAALVLAGRRRIQRQQSA